MTKLVNNPKDIVQEMLEGYAAAYPEIIRLTDGLIVRTKPKEAGKVGLVIGNGSGHEPAMIGWVGNGLFDVNIPGPIFTSPGPAKIAEGIQAADTGGGVLVCVSNHSGDVLNAEMALERIADSTSCRAEMVVLYDDVSSAPKGREQDRRGSAGLFFVWKIVGAYAEEGASLEQCKAMAERVRDNTRTISAGLTGCAHPVTGEPIAEVPNNEIVIGVGIHGEGGVDSRPVMTADETMDTMLSVVLDDLPYGAGDDVCVLVNNAGSLTQMELAILYRRANQMLTERGMRIHRAWLGSYATTQDTAGFAISICRVDAEMRRLYDSPAIGAGVVFSPASPTQGQL